MKKLQTLALGLAFALAGSAFAGTMTRDVTVTHQTPHGAVTRHVVRTHEDARDYGRHHHMKRVVRVNHGHHYGQYRHVRRVEVVHPSRHGHYAVNRTVVVHHRG